MNASIDIYGLLIAAFVVALFGWFFWHTAKGMFGYGRQISEFLDSSAKRQRAALEREAKFGRLPLWYRVGQIVSLGTLVAGITALAWMKIKGF